MHSPSRRWSHWSPSRFVLPTAQSCIPYSCLKANPRAQTRIVYIRSISVNHAAISAIGCCIVFIHSPIARYKSKSAASHGDGDVPCTNVEIRTLREDATEGRGEGGGYGWICNAARRRHGGCFVFKWTRSFDIQLIRDQNRDSSESASHFETDSGRVREANISHACARACVEASRCAVVSPSVAPVQIMKEKILFIIRIQARVTVSEL